MSYNSCAISLSICIGNRKKSFKLLEMSSFIAQVDALIPAGLEDTTFTSFGRILDADMVRTNLHSFSVSASAMYLLICDSITGQQVSSKRRTFVTCSAFIFGLRVAGKAEGCSPAHPSPQRYSYLPTFHQVLPEYRRKAKGLLGCTRRLGHHMNLVKMREMNC